MYFQESIQIQESCTLMLGTLRANRRGGNENVA